MKSSHRLILNQTLHRMGKKLGLSRNSRDHPPALTSETVSPSLLSVFFCVVAVTPSSSSFIKCSRVAIAISNCVSRLRVGRVSCLPSPIWWFVFLSRGSSKSAVQVEKLIKASFRFCWHDITNTWLCVNIPFQSLDLLIGKLDPSSWTICNVHWASSDRFGYMVHQSMHIECALALGANVCEFIDKIFPKFFHLLCLVIFADVPVINAVPYFTKILHDCLFVVGWFSAECPCDQWSLIESSYQQCSCHFCDLS